MADACSATVLHCLGRLLWCLLGPYSFGKLRLTTFFEHFWLIKWSPAGPVGQVAADDVFWPLCTLSEAAWKPHFGIMSSFRNVENHANPLRICIFPGFADFRAQTWSQSVIFLFSCGWGKTSLCQHWRVQQGVFRANGLPPHTGNSLKSIANMCISCTGWFFPPTLGGGSPFSDVSGSHFDTLLEELNH